MRLSIGGALISANCYVFKRTQSQAPLRTCPDLDLISASTSVCQCIVQSYGLTDNSAPHAQGSACDGSSPELWDTHEKRIGAEPTLRSFCSWLESMTRHLESY